MSVPEQYSPAFLEEVVGDRFGRYSKYIIQDRAIPDVRDGLKPVQRRILYAMYEAGNTPDKPYRKSAKTVGDVMGNYHPHGDASIYEGMVRMAQPWKMAHMLVDGHGNWGSMDDDPAAAMRYTEARLSSIAMELLRDIEKRTVQFKDNFDNTTKEPVVLPSRYPNLLVNGVSGISSGFATEIPTHNLREVIDACVALIDNADISLEELMQVIKGPDFPTGGIIMGSEGIKEAYRTGKGRIYIRAKTAIEEMKGGRQQIVITEIPYQVVKSKLVTSIETIRIEKKVEGIAEVRDESGRNGLRIVIELKKEADAQGILTYLLKKTDLQVAYSFNMVAIVNKTPRQLGLKEMLSAYVDHQKEVVTRRSQFELEKAEDRAHILEGLVKALSILDQVIETIRASKNRQDAQQNLIDKFGFTERQADAILTLQLYRLTNLEITTLEKELKEIRKTIDYLRGILSSERKLMGVIKTEMTEIAGRFGIDRRSDIQEEVEELKVNLEVMVTPEDVLVTLSNDGYLKRTSMMSYTRSGGEIESSGVKEGDYIRHILEVNTIDNLLICTQKGLSFVLPVHQVPEYKWKENGTAIVNVIPIAKEDRIVSVIPVKSFDEPGKSLVFVTKRGQVKRTELKEYYTNRTGGIVAIKLAEQDEVVEVALSDNTKEILIVTRLGMSIRFKEMEVNPMGRAAAGVRGISLRDEDEVVAAAWVEGEEGEILVISDLGYAKSSLLLDYPVQGRGGKGIITFEFKEGKRVKPNGTALQDALFVKHAFQLTAIMKSGAQHTFSTEEASIEDRKSPGKSVIPLAKGDLVTAVVKRPTPV
ncbi:DNA gyrase subunit A [Paenibacillus flagellatus]|uniref:DNA topoisomerase (ATP-hydrolyzing) n=1 Tax=Paenibacillus flagellatus TaxID=2211139 RepID=A0A2V5KJM6_9BACL|nr:DNA gyrase subunit A [Paenibacillus flagellatus]PYI54830.1 DNA gyrase subunit A [Paenibacillus flagellatus]